MSRVARTARAAVPAALVTLAAAACTGGLPGGTGPAQEAAHAGGDHHAAHATSAIAVGPLSVNAADYWSVLQPSDGVTVVRAGGCPEDASCPSFEVLSGEAAAGVDPAQAYLPEGATCPGPDAPTPQGAIEVSREPVEIDGSTGELTRYRLSCVDASGTEMFSAEQLQWYVPESPAGAVVVVDRWAFEGLESRLTAATWVASA